MFCRWWAVLILIPWTTASSAPEQTPGEHWWGVLVGVGQYEHLDPSLALEGPPNDVPLMVTWLRRQGVPRAHLTVLADQVAHSDGLPTRGAILGALAELPRRMHRGDIAFLYFAGHGSQQPQGGRQWSKSDGLDEIFLPRDVGRWDGASGQVQGAIIDYEIGRAVDLLRAQGIFVWLVFDSCHSATMARAPMLAHVRLRAVPSPQLGVPPLAPDAARKIESSADRAVDLQRANLPGGYVAFYAAQTVDSAPELPLPPGEPGRQVHGLFTYSLLKALGATQAGSYREVAHRILALYSSIYPASTPEFEGSLDAPIGAPSAPIVAPTAWPAQRTGTGFRIDAGRLNGLTPGSLAALYAPVPVSKSDPPLGLLRVNRVSLAEAWAEPVPDQGELRAWGISSDRSAELATGVVRVLRTGVDTTIRLAGPAPCFSSLPPPAGCGATRASATDTAMVESARRMMSKAGSLPTGAEFTQDIDAADLFLIVRSRRLLIVQSATTDLDRAAGIDLDAGSAPDELRGALFSASRSVALTRLARDYPGKPGELSTQVRIQEPGGRWQPIDRQPSTPIALNTELQIRLQNTGSQDLDVTILWVNERFGIVPVYPVDQESNLLRAGSAAVQFLITAATPGSNRLVFIIERAQSGRPHDLSYLAQTGVTRRADDPGFAGLLERIGFTGRGTRSGISQADGEATSMKIVQFEVAADR
jgi:hypothetical protein